MNTNSKLAAEIEAIRQRVLALAKDLSELITSIDSEDAGDLDLQLSDAHAELISSADYLTSKDSDACPIRALVPREGADNTEARS